MEEEEKIVVICGPTATGKTSLGVKLCREFDGEIVSVDSRQVYRELEIGVGKLPLSGGEVASFSSRQKGRALKGATTEEKELGDSPPAESEFNIERNEGFWIIDGVKVHLYDLISPEEELNAVQFARIAGDRIERIWSRGKVPFLVGGAGLYLEILLGMVEVAKVPKNPELREELSQLSQEELVERLEEVDPERARTIDKNSPHRVMRAIEIAVGRSADSSTRPDKSGRVSSADRGSKTLKGVTPEDNGSGTVKVLPEDIERLWIGLNAPRKYLYDKIDRRVDRMVEAGLLDEVGSLVEKYGWDAPALDSIGYIEFKKYFEEEKSKEEQIQRVKYNTHAYARRQLTWFRRNEDINWLDITDENFEHKAEEMIRLYLKRNCSNT